MQNPVDVINQALGSIQEQQSYRAIPLESGHRVVKDLGFTSLDVAQLIAMLEMELGVDPFGDGRVSIMDVHTVGDLHRVYT